MEERNVQDRDCCEVYQQGAGIVLALSLINSLSIDEEILHDRMENIEQTTQITRASTPAGKQIPRE
jgi:hypothetical protein